MGYRRSRVEGRVSVPDSVTEEGGDSSVGREDPFAGREGLTVRPKGGVTEGTVESLLGEGGETDLLDKTLESKKRTFYPDCCRESSDTSLV